MGGELYHPDASTEPSLGSFAALGRVLRDKIAARARNGPAVEKYQLLSYASPRSE